MTRGREPSHVVGPRTAPATADRVEMRARTSRDASVPTLANVNDAVARARRARRRRDASGRIPSARSATEFF